jgi:hypothetical protein
MAQSFLSQYLLPFLTDLLSVAVRSSQQQHTLPGIFQVLYPDQTDDYDHSHYPLVRHPPQSQVLRVCE